MGQYQQWLRYREIEQQLRMQIETLETELVELQARARSLEESDSSLDVDAGHGDNELLRLLSLAMRLDVHTSYRASEPASNNGAASSAPTFTNAGAEVARSGEQREPAGAEESFSPTLFTWGRPSDFGPQEMPATAQQPTSEGLSFSSLPSPLPRTGLELLPEDIAAFFEEHSQTDPQLEIPWWQRQGASPANVHNSGLIDQQDMRNKHEVERWFERWRRQPAQPAQSENQGETPHE